MPHVVLLACGCFLSLSFSTSHSGKLPDARKRTAKKLGHGLLTHSLEALEDGRTMLVLVLFFDDTGDLQCDNAFVPDENLDRLLQCRSCQSPHIASERGGKRTVHSEYRMKCTYLGAMVL